MESNGMICPHLTQAFSYPGQLLGLKPSISIDWMSSGCMTWSGMKIAIPPVMDPVKRPGITVKPILVKTGPINGIEAVWLL
jgi:hypothetical protein